MKMLQIIKRLTIYFSVFLALLLPSSFTAKAELVSLGQFDPSEVGGIVGAGYDSTTNSVWVYGSFEGDINEYSPTGTFLSSISSPGEGANDVDLDFASESFLLGRDSVAAGSMLFFNGESGTADIFALDASSGSIISSLATSFGTNHVVGGAYHPGRNSFFLVADRNDASPSTIAEIDPITGLVINTFGTGSPDYTINFGDIAVNSLTSNLLLVSSDETHIRELSPTGSFLQDLLLPAGVNSLSGIGLDDISGEAFLTGTGGTVWHVGGITTIPEPKTAKLLFASTIIFAFLNWRFRTSAL